MVLRLRAKVPFPALWMASRSWTSLITKNPNEGVRREPAVVDLFRSDARRSHTVPLGIVVDEEVLEVEHLTARHIALIERDHRDDTLVAGRDDVEDDGDVAPAFERRREADATDDHAERSEALDVALGTAACVAGVDQGTAGVAKKTLYM